MKHAKVFLTLAFLMFAAISIPAQAGCGDSKAECYLYKKGKLVAKSACAITECSNMDNYLARWTWHNGKETSVDMKGDDMKVNDKPGFFERKGKLSCYGTNKHKETLYCTNN